MERFKKFKKELSSGYPELSSLGAFKRKIVSLAVMVSLVAFSFVPMATSAPVQDDAAGSWDDSFSDDTGVDWNNSSQVVVKGGDVIISKWAKEVVEWWGGATGEISIAVDSNNNPHMSFMKGVSLKYAERTLGFWNKKSVDLCWGYGNSLALDNFDKPRISYYDSITDDLKYARDANEDGDFNDPGEIVTVDSVGDVGMDHFLALDNFDRPHISYYDNTNKDIKYAHDANGDGDFNDPGEVVAVDSGRGYSSIALDSGDHPHISYMGNGHVPKYAHDANGDGDFNDPGEIVTVNNLDRAFFTSIALDSGNHPHISYSENIEDLKYARDANGDGDFSDPGEVVAIDSIPCKKVWDTSIALDSLDNPYISYSVVTNADSVSHLKLAQWNGSSWELEEIFRSSRGIPSSVSIALDKNDKAHIGFSNLEDTGINNTLYFTNALDVLSGTLVSVPITPTMIDSWDTFSATDNTASGNITYSILDGSDLSILKNNVTNGQDISDIDATAHPTIRLKASISATGNPAVSAILHDWGITWTPDATPPVFNALEAKDKNDTWIDDTPPDNVVADYLTDPKVTITSDFDDGSGSGIFDHKIHFAKDGVWAAPHNCGATGICSVDICTVYICPLPAGTVIKYKSEATDNAIPPNPTAYSPEKSFTVIDLSVTLSANPNSGSAPLNNVDLTATVGGTAAGDITYIFDCDISVAGTDHTYTGASNPYTAADICNYAVANTYTASVEVTRQGITATNTTPIIVNPPNNLPVMTSVTITPDPAYTNNDLTATPAATDADGDPITYSYQWIKNGGDIAGETSETLLSANFIKNDIMEVTVTPNDGIDDGLPMTSPALTISNSAPTQPTVSIDPSSPVETDDLACNISIASTDADAGDTINYTYEWFKDGGLQGGETTNTINSGLTSIGENWKCKVTPDDGTDNGPSDEASVIISDSSVVQAYSCNSTSLDPCGLELQNISIDPEDCPGGYPCVTPPDNGFLSCLWDIDSGTSTYPVCSGITVSLTVGGHTADLRVTDQGGLFSFAPQKNLVFKKDAYADFECSLDAGLTWENCGALAVNPEIDNPIDFRAVDGGNLSTPSDSAALTGYDWDFGDGVGTSAVNPTSYIYTAENSYSVILTVTDSAGRRARVSRAVTVGAATVDIPKRWREIAPKKSD